MGEEKRETQGVEPLPRVYEGTRVDWYSSVVTQLSFEEIETRLFCIIAESGNSNATVSAVNRYYDWLTVEDRDPGALAEAMNLSQATLAFFEKRYSSIILNFGADSMRGTPSALEGQLIKDTIEARRSAVQAKKDAVSEKVRVRNRNIQLHLARSATKSEIAELADADCVTDELMRELFEKEEDNATDAQKKACGKCAYQNTCLLAALENGVQGGVWGGLDQKERELLMVRIGSFETSEEAIAEALSIAPPYVELV